MKKFVAVAGNIGVGKSTLVGMLCAKLGWEPFYEPVTGLGGPGQKRVRGC
jgi:deoxyadenosine/deoxycytidine kinase